MKPWIALLALTLASQAVFGEELYRWVDAEGNVTYSDTPPPPDVASAESKKFIDRAGTQQMPYALQLATREFPVTLYTTDCGDGCVMGVKLLQARGVPFATKDAKDPKVQTELAKLADGKILAPVLVVGKNVVKGFEDGAWHSALDAAGYPKHNLLTRNQVNKSVADRPASPAAKPSE